MRHAPIALLVAGSFAAGCGAPSAVPTLSAPAAGVAPAAGPASPPKPALDAPPEGCHATLVSRPVVDRLGRRASDWARIGTVAVTMKDRRPVSFVVKDGDGKSVSSMAAPESQPAFRDAVRGEVCRIGGVSVVAEADPPDNGAYALSVWKPVAPDEAADLAYVCKGPPGPVGESMEPEKLRVIAVEAYEVMLGSPRWRAFFRALHDELRARGANVDEVRKRRADELRAASKDCWFAKVLSP